MSASPVGTAHQPALPYLRHSGFAFYLPSAEALG